MIATHWQAVTFPAIVRAVAGGERGSACWECRCEP